MPLSSSKRSQLVLDLCSGIGGFALAGLLVGGFETVAFCENNPFCQKILNLRFPTIPIFDDIKNVSVNSLQSRGIWQIDGICAGLPCQPYSDAGTRKGEEDPRNLFPEFFRILRDVRPRWAIIENVPGLHHYQKSEFFRKILWEFTKIGYDCEWQIVSAASVGAVHIRQRIWIVAYLPHNLPHKEKHPNTNSVGCDSRSDNRRERQIQLHEKRNHQTSSKNRAKHYLKFGKVCTIFTDSSLQRWRTSCCKISERTAASSGCSPAPLSHIPGKPILEPLLCRGDDGLSIGLERSLLTHQGLDDWLVASTIPNFTRLSSSEIATLSQSEQESYRETYQQYQSIKHIHKERLKALGNAIVIQCAAVSMRRLKKILSLAC